MCPEVKESVHHLTGKQCRELLYMRMKKPKRIVPAFTYQALQSNTVVEPPKKIDLFKKRPVKETFFRVYLRRGDIPVARSGKVLRKKNATEFPLKWFCAPQDLDYCYYLPIFVDGYFFDRLSDSDIEIRQLAQYGAMDMIVKAPHKVLPVLPKMILPLKRAFNTRDKKIIIAALKVLQMMVLVGNFIDPDRERRIADVIEDTLNALEKCGGPNAFINIKYMIPTYESCVYPLCDLGVENSPAESSHQKKY
ncbi:parkin coregulated gene protein-like isoform X3 [Musca domestica]|uniref:Parkin coregulated gene protein-like isoform X3 n=1 Tax=Musca domestica TaxID=7370 RepID=A0ABM3V6X7_MUSDO|nr:parkin coregulated gene protein-like isoform X3 [Musca domestica]